LSTLHQMRKLPNKTGLSPNIADKHTHSTEA